MGKSLRGRLKISEVYYQALTDKDKSQLLSSLVAFETNNKQADGIS